MRTVVVDVETTGFGRNDRIVEIALVTAEVSSVLDEFETLVNPLRDVGPAHIHGVTASMVGPAPVFEEVAPAIAERLHGAVMVAHNPGLALANAVGRTANQSGVVSIGTSDSKPGGSQADDIAVMCDWLGRIFGKRGPKSPGDMEPSEEDKKEYWEHRTGESDGDDSDEGTAGSGDPDCPTDPDEP